MNFLNFPWGHHHGQPRRVLCCGSLPMPNSPSLGKPRKCCAETHVLTYFKVSPGLSALLNETLLNAPGFPRGC